MKITTVIVGPIRTNCYLVTSDKGSDAVIIDPGDEAEKIIAEIEREDLKPAIIVNTHAHPDHVGANRELSEKYGIEAAVSARDHEMIKGWGAYFEEFSQMRIDDLAMKRFLIDGDIIKAGQLELKVIETPGHSEGGICLYGEGVLFSGDTLFHGDTGRTDIPGGSDSKMEISIAKLMDLPLNTMVYPGHGRPTTIKKERLLYAQY